MPSTAHSTHQPGHSPTSASPRADVYAPLQSQADLEEESPGKMGSNDVNPSILAIAYCNDPPTYEQEKAARERLDAIREESRPLDREIQEIQSQLRELERHLSRLKDRKSTLQEEQIICKSILSPWRRLPTDILAEILQVAINPESLSFLSERNPGTNRDHFKDLREVCQTWREVAFSTHSLWTSAWVDLDRYSDDDLPKAIRNIQCYFQRSGPSLPLNIGFNWSMSRLVGPEGEDPWNLWLDFLSAFRGRWEEISFFTDVYHFQLFEGQLKRELDLEKGIWKVLFLQVVLEDTSSSDTLVPADPGVFNELFPDLETINLNSASDSLITVNQSYSRLLDPHTTMRKLRLEVYYDLNPYFQKLGGFPNLKKLLFNCPKLNVTPVLAEGNVVELPCLELLLMACPPSFTILSRLRTPSLKTLQLLTNVPPEPATSDSTTALQQGLMGSFNHVIAFAEQCNKTLREMRINCWFLQAEYALLCLLGALSSVEYLCIDTWFQPAEQSLPSGLRASIVDDIRNSSYLPNLRKLCLHDPQDEETPLPAATETSCPDFALVPPATQRRLASYRDALPWHTDASIVPSSSNLSGPRRPSVADVADPQDGQLEQTVPYTPFMLPPPLDVLVHIPANTLEDEDVADPFVRGAPSWKYLQWFLQSSHKRSQEPRVGVRARTGDEDGKKFEFCFSGRALDAGGEDAKFIVRSLGQEGLNIDREPSCRVYW